VSPVGHERGSRVRAVHSQLGLAPQGGQSSQGSLPAERLYLDGQGSFAQRADKLRSVGHDDEAARATGVGHDLLPQESPAASLDQG
jgi:hypothetical protein